MNREQLTHANQLAAGLDKVYKDQGYLEDIKEIKVHAIEENSRDAHVFGLADYPQLLEKVVKLLQAELPEYRKTITKEFESL